LALLGLVTLYAELEGLARQALYQKEKNMRNTTNMALEAADRLLFLAAMGRLDHQTLAAAAAEKEDHLLLLPDEAPSEPPVEAEEVVEPPHHLRACRRRTARRERANRAATREVVSRREARATKGDGFGLARWADRQMASSKTDEAWERKNSQRRCRVRFMLSGVSRKGAEDLILRGMEVWREQGLGSLPYNLYKAGPLIGLPYGRRLDGVQSAVGHYARVGGFLGRAATSPVARPLVTFIKKVTTPNGQNSPYTRLDVSGLPAAFGSPEAASRKLVAVRRRANQILGGYGVCVSNASLAGVMTRYRATGKAARIAAMITLRDLLQRAFGVDTYQLKGWNVFFVARGMAAAMKEDPVVRHWVGGRLNAGEFADLRSAMAAKSRLVVDRTDGVEMILDSATTVAKLGVEVSLGLLPVTGRRGRKVVQERFLVRKGERTFHADVIRVERWDPLAGCYRKADPIGSAIRQALAAWRRQEESEVSLRRDFRIPEGVSLLVYKADSHAVGNCREGTEVFMRKLGLSPTTELVGSHILSARAGEDSRAERVIRYAASELQRWLRSDIAIAPVA
jgi:hypothetical protein